MTKIETTGCDAADYLNRVDVVVAYMSAYLEDGSPEEIRAPMGTVACSRGISELARRTGMSGASLSKALGANGNPSFKTVRSIMHALGLGLTVQVVEQEPSDA